jgi:hypothetical protein
MNSSTGLLMNHGCHDLGGSHTASRQAEGKPRPQAPFAPEKVSGKPGSSSSALPSEAPQPADCRSPHRKTPRSRWSTKILSP